MAIEQIDLFAVNDVFASVPLARLKTLVADSDKLDVRSGEIAPGRPLGVSGAMWMSTLIHALHSARRGRGLLSICGGIADVTIRDAPH
jgi:acetyl-CoA acetyltransferase